MPTYYYQCKQCTHGFELTHGMSEEPRPACPACGGFTQRLTRKPPAVLTQSVPEPEPAPAEDVHHCSENCALHRPDLWR